MLLIHPALPYKKLVVVQHSEHLKALAVVLALENHPLDHHHICLQYLKPVKSIAQVKSQMIAPPHSQQALMTPPLGLGSLQYPCSLRGGQTAARAHKEMRDLEIQWEAALG